MSDCEEKIYSNDYVDFIISKDVLDVIDLSSDCIQRIDEEKDTYFYPRSFFRIFDFPADSYASVPKCYGLLDETALEVSGILKLQQQPALALKGQGVMIGFICGFVGAGGGMMMLLVLTSVLGYELKTAVGTSVFVMAFTAFTGSISHFAIGGAPDWWTLAFCMLSTLIFAQIAAFLANKAKPETLNRVTGVILVILGIVMIIVNKIK